MKNKIEKFESVNKHLRYIKNEKLNSELSKASKTWKLFYNGARKKFEVHDISLRRVEGISSLILVEPLAWRKSSQDALKYNTKNYDILQDYDMYDKVRENSSNIMSKMATQSRVNKFNDAIMGNEWTDTEKETEYAI